MDAKEFKCCLRESGLSLVELAQLLGMTRTALWKYIERDNVSNPAMVLLLRLFREKPELVEKSWELVGQPEGYKKANKRGRPPRRFED